MLTTRNKRCFFPLQVSFIQHQQSPLPSRYQMIIHHQERSRQLVLRRGAGVPHTFKGVHVQPP
ncbi:hypothetical protein I7I53_08891 [Histoplasma capsulatum var. duboisii H88]|uniref:Uncharacterized protein n=1 Tax=Ajellomyces capsulatus (strain H88) TaxID=544711 RepID=A0A8A1L3Y7_AJEC8|nr:hypothetical protein I7I53_08891 [Histoplasma capsulatum var. duboisii H88]